MHRHTEFKGQRNYILYAYYFSIYIILCCTDLSHARETKTHMPNLFPSTIIYIDDVYIRGGSNIRILYAYDMRVPTQKRNHPTRDIRKIVYYA